MNAVAPWSSMTETEKTTYAMRARELCRVRTGKYFIASFAAAVGCDYDALRRRYEPGYAGKRNGVCAKWRRGRRSANAAAGLTGEKKIDPPTADEVAARWREMPKDTRSVTGAVMGDPLPGDKRRANYQEQFSRRAITLPPIPGVK
jgi:hypothetical protein